MKFAQKIARFAAQQRAIRELNAMDSRQLADLGITHADIRNAVRGSL